MLSRLRANSELLSLSALMIAFLFAAVHYKQAGNEALPRTAPSSLNAGAPGAKALFLLLSRLGFRADRQEANWQALTSEGGLLIVIEPLVQQRAPTTAEIAALRQWVERGGTVLYCVTEPPRPLQPDDPLAGDLAIVAGSAASHLVEPEPTGSPYLREVKQISMSCPVRLAPAPGTGYQTLVRDADGAILVAKPIGRGHLVVAANLNLTSNAGIQQADNAVVMVNVVSAAIGTTGKTVLFDEYHHGAGFEGDAGAQTESLWYNIPFPARLTLLHLLGLFGLLVYNGSRRFGMPRPLPTPTARSGADYVASMARLYGRAQSADIAAAALGAGFRRDLIRTLELSPEATIDQILASVQRRYQQDPAPLGTLLQRCAQIDAGTRIAQAELLSLAQQIAEWRRRLEFVGA
jgi:hypothetical protein